MHEGNESIRRSREAARYSHGGVSHRFVCWVYVGIRRLREAELSMANNKRGPERGSQKAKHGGQAVREKYGPEFYSRIGKKGGEAVKEKRGPQFYAEIGKKGGESTKRQQGSEFYSRIGKKGGEHGRAVAADKDL